MLADLDQILENLAKDVENAVHALYRGEVRQNTARAHTGQLVQGARAKIAEIVGTQGAAAGADGRAEPVSTSPRPRISAPAIAGVAHGWTQEDSDAVFKCINAWLPMGGPHSTAADTLCIAPGKMLIPTWGERERAREAVKKLTQ